MALCMLHAILGNNCDMLLDVSSPLRATDRVCRIERRLSGVKPINLKL